jgi:hypothetical protein
MDGSFFQNQKFDSNLAYGQVKLVGALWMAHLARTYPELRFITVSPGNTTGTNAAENVALPLRLAAKYIMPILGLSHGLEDGAKRFLDGATNPRFSSGVFYASPAGKMKGAMVDQTPIFPELASQSFQENANEAIHRFLA